MINETLEVMQLLDGQNIYKDSLYRDCLLLAMWYCEQGLSKIETRQKIFDWANQYHINLELSVNATVNNAFKTTRRLRDESSRVFISKEDVKLINAHFDKAVVKKIALGMLCLAKVSADKKGVFTLPLTAVAHWAGVSKSTMSKRYLPEIEDFEYAQRVEDTAVSVWDKRASQPRNKALKYKMLVPLHNTGEFKLVDNDLSRLYAEAFNEGNK